MRTQYLWILLLFVVGILEDSPVIVEGTLYKAYETGGNVIDAFYCGTQIADAYKQYCVSTKRRRRKSTN